MAVVIESLQKVLIAMGGGKMYQYKAEILRVIDGDTVKARLDMGFHTYKTTNLRLSGIDAPERHQKGGPEATGWLSLMLAKDSSNLSEFAPCYVETEKKDKFGRWLAWIYLTEIEMKKSGVGDSLNIRMVNEGLAKFYSGGKR
jgi:micrococcal nuclease